MVVEVVAELQVAFGEAIVQPHGQIATRDLAESVRQARHHRGLLFGSHRLRTGIALALAFALPPLLFGLTLEPPLLDFGISERQNRTRHLADLVGAALVRDVDIDPALRKLTHGVDKTSERARDATADRNDPETRDHKPEQTKHGHQHGRAIHIRVAERSRIQDRNKGKRRDDQRHGGEQAVQLRRNRKLRELEHLDLT